MNEKEREIFIHNHEPLINVLLQQGYEQYTDLKSFLKVHKDRFRVKLRISYQTLINYLNFEDIKERHTSTLQVQAFAKCSGSTNRIK